VKGDQQYLKILGVEPPVAETPLARAQREYVFGEVWDRSGLSMRDRRLVSLAGVASTNAVSSIDAQVYAALQSGDLTLQELHEFVLHFAVYCGWPKASQLEVSLRTQWIRYHEVQGLDAPAWPDLPLNDLGPVALDERLAQGHRAFEEVNHMALPLADTPYLHSGVVTFVFGHVWERPGLTRRERRLITVACVGASEALIPIVTHVTAALASGDIPYGEMQELILQFAVDCGFARAQVLSDVAEDWRRSQP
jgi:4-carboxymuconolactone decarboxylase